MEPCAPGVALDDLGCPVPPKCVNALHHFHLDFHNLLFPQVIDT